MSTADELSRPVTARPLPARDGSSPPANQARRIDVEVRLEFVWTLCLTLRQPPPDACDKGVRARVAAKDWVPEQPNSRDATCSAQSPAIAHICAAAIACPSYPLGIVSRRVGSHNEALMASAGAVWQARFW